MLSCDTLALSAQFFAGAKNMLGKNSDRPLGEAQPLAFFPAADYAPGSVLRCTHLNIPQVSHTYALLGSQPYWIWGFEMGANEKGLFIGNEAQGSRCEAEKAEGLLGMDLLRLALERAATASEAIDVIAGLLKKYGQNANANMLYDRRYENSYLLVDEKEIWLMETAGRQWAAKRIDDWTAISNCYLISSDYDRCSEDLESYARERRWLGKNEKFDFARAYTAPAPRQTASVPRCRRLHKLISENNGPLDFEAVKAIFRDHFTGELITPRYGACYGGFTTICMHALTWDSSQTASSLLCTYDDQLGFVFRYAPSLPCCSVYLPVYWTMTLPESVSFGGGMYCEKSLWWCTERLATLIGVDEDRFGPSARAELSAFETAVENETAKAEAEAKALVVAGKKAEAIAVLNTLTEQAADGMMKLVAELAEKISAELEAEGGLYGPRKEFTEAYATRVGMPL